MKSGQQADVTNSSAKEQRSQSTPEESSEYIAIDGPIRSLVCCLVASHVMVLHIDSSLISAAFLHIRGLNRLGSVHE
jgi:hypothetical protein